MKSAAQPIANRSPGRGPFLHEAENVGSSSSGSKLDYRLADAGTWRAPRMKGRTECPLEACFFPYHGPYIISSNNTNRSQCVILATCPARFVLKATHPHGAPVRWALLWSLLLDEGSQDVGKPASVQTQVCFYFLIEV